MIKILQFIANKYLDKQLDFRLRLFNILAISGFFLSLIIAALGVIINVGALNVISNLAAAVAACVLLIYTNRSGRYQLGYILAIVTVFFILFPILFFSAGGYHSGMPAFFIFAVLFTFIMLDGKKVFAIAALELCIYAGICIYAYYRPESIDFLQSETAILADIIVSFLLVSIIIGITLFLHLRLYNGQQLLLAEQNHRLAEISRMKTEFLTNASHEMRTPLTVTSVNVQTVMEILEDMGDTLTNPEAEKLLKSAQSEIMRLSRMVGSMLTLASMSENTDRQKLDFSSLIQNGIDVLSLNLAQRGNTIKTDIESQMSIFGNADLLTQVLTNILQNVGKHTENGTVTVCAKRKGNDIAVTVQDTGTGISPELLPRVFERGVSTGGTGFGLCLCKTVVESHGGRIWIESEPGNGTTVHYILPFYEGQFGVDEA